jgi:hypothetical protein
MRIFKDSAEYQAFTGGVEYITPNMCLIEDSFGLICKPEIIEEENNGLQFPVYLVEGDNGQLGIDAFNYIINCANGAPAYILKNDEKIFFTFENGNIFNINEFWYTDGSINYIEAPLSNGYYVVINENGMVSTWD